MPLIKNSKLIKAMPICADDKRYSILKLLNQTGKMRFIELKNIISPNDKHTGRFSYHMRKLVKHKIVKLNPINRCYVITEFGQTILQIIDKYSEQFMTDEQDAVCKNSNNDEHDYIKLCRKCGAIKELTKTKKQIEVIAK